MENSTNEKMRVGILGPEGTFSEIAARYWLMQNRVASGDSSGEEGAETTDEERADGGRERTTEKTPEKCELRYYETISDIYEGLLHGEVDLGIVPIENSIEGSVSDTLDILSSECDECGDECVEKSGDESSEKNGEDSVRGIRNEASGIAKERTERTFIQMIGEILLPIRICLLGRSSDVRKVVSHPHALAQCKRFLKELRRKGVEVKAVESTALAAKIASESAEEEGIAALASEEAARRYGLNVLARDVQDRESVTRFVVLARDARTKPTGHDKTSILIYLKDRPGALYEVLGEFAKRNINLTKIESRPSKKALGDYMFHIDCEGHVDDDIVREALNGVRRKVAMLKILGSYPRDTSNLSQRK